EEMNLRVRTVDNLPIFQGGLGSVVLSGNELEFSIEQRSNGVFRIRLQDQINFGSGPFRLVLQETQSGGYGHGYVFGVLVFELEEQFPCICRFAVAAIQFD